MSPKAGESNLLRQDDVHRVALLLLARAAGVSQQVLPLLTDELAVLGVSQPRLTAAKEHDAHSAQDNHAGEQGQHAEADELAVGVENARGVDRLLQGDLEQVSLGRSEKLVEGVSGEGVVLRSQREHPVVHGLCAGRLGPGLRSVLQGAGGAREPLLANAPEGSVGLADTHPPVGTGPAGARRVAGVVTGETGEADRTDARETQAAAGAVAAVEAGVRLAAVNADLTKFSRRSGGT